VRKLKGGPRKYKEREDSDDEEEYISIIIGKKTIDEENEYNKKENPNS
jgi:hypothetical protein